MKSRSAQEEEDEALARRLQQEEEEEELQGKKGKLEGADELAACFAQFDLGTEWQHICKNLGAESVSDLLVLRDSDIDAAVLKPVTRRKLLNMLRSLRADFGHARDRGGNHGQQSMSLEEELAFFLSATGCNEEEAVHFLGNGEGLEDALETWWESHPDGVAQVRPESGAGNSGQPRTTPANGNAGRTKGIQATSGASIMHSASSKPRGLDSGGYAGSSPVEPAPSLAQSRKVDGSNKAWYSRARGEWVNPDSKETDRDRYLRQIAEKRKNPPPTRLRPKKSTGFPARTALANMRNPQSYF